MDPTLATKPARNEPSTRNSADESTVRLITDATAYRPPAYFRHKPWIDRTLALLLLLPGLPMIGLLILLIRATSRGPAIFCQRRVGLHGRVFTMFKLRSMVIDAEARTGPVWSVGNDPRVTILGGILRKLHLDELPQLWNVFRGEMALTGPRPERPEIAAQLAECIPGYGRRLAVLPGITGLAQINLPPDTSLACVQRKLVVDLEYIQDASFLLDVRMIACSLLRLVGFSGDRAMRMMQLTRTPEIPKAWLEQQTESDAGASSLWWVRPASTAANDDSAALADDSHTETWPALRASP